VISRQGLVRIIKALIQEKARDYALQNARNLKIV
jgi:hypothetical protein